MNSLIVCNAASDNISKISLVESLTDKVSTEEILLTIGERPHGPNGIYINNDIAYILNRISPEWIYVELIDKKTQQKKVHKMYASDKEWNTFRVFK